MNMNLSSATRSGLNILALLALSIALYLGKEIFVPLVIAAILACILWPVTTWLHRRVRLPWFFACLTAVSLFVVLNLGVFIGVSAAIPKLLQDLPNPYEPAKAQKIYSDLRGQIQKYSKRSIEDVLPSDPNASALYGYFRKTMEGDSIPHQLGELARVGLSWLWQSVLIVFILLFLQMEGDMLARRVKEIAGASITAQEQVTAALSEMANSVRAYLVWRTLVNIGLGIFLGIVYSQLGLSQGWTWALITAVLTYVPYLGTILAGIPPVLDALLLAQDKSPELALGILLFYAVVVTIEGYFIIPVVMGRSMDLNATTVMLACLYWDLVWGITGLFLAMPLMAGIRAVCMHVEGWRPWGNLMSTSRWVDAANAVDRLTPAMDCKPLSDDATVIIEAAKPQK